MYVIYGIKRKQGEYLGKPYDNHVIGTVDRDTTLSSVVVGFDVDLQKVRTSVWNSILAQYNYTNDDVLGMGVSFIYDKWQNVVNATFSPVEVQS